MAKRDFYNKKILSQKSNNKKYWQTINEILNHKSSPNYPEYFIDDEKKIDNDHDIANSFNNYFVKIGPNLAKNIDLPKFTNKLHGNYSSSFFLKPTDSDEVSKIIGTLNRAAAGWDEMNLDIFLTVSLNAQRSNTQLN